MARAVRFDQYGDRDVLYVADVDVPAPAGGEVLIRVRAAAINPGEASIRSGALAERFPAVFPSGQGTDLAGTVSVVGDGVQGFAPGDEVLGWTWRRASHAEYVTVPSDQLILKPSTVSWAAAGSLGVAGVTAYAAVRAILAGPGDTVVVSAASGGVGVIVVQLLRERGATVLGIASAPNHDWLRAHGATPIAYGDDVAERLRQAAPNGVDAFIDLFGPEYVSLALDLGVPPARIETIISFDRAQEVGAMTQGSGDATSTDVLSELVDLIVGGELEIPIAASYPLDQVREAFAVLEQRHTRGKIVLTP